MEGLACYQRVRLWTSIVSNMCVWVKSKINNNSVNRREEKTEKKSGGTIKRVNKTEMTNQND